MKFCTKSHKQRGVPCLVLLFCFFSINLFASEPLAPLKTELRRLLSEKACLEVPPLARQILNSEPNDLESLQAIEKCTRDSSKTNYSEKAKEIFNNSKLISLVPDLLRSLQSKERLSVADYLALSELYQKLGEPEKELEMFEKALNTNKNDPRIKLILARSQFESGHRTAARESYRDYLKASSQHSDRFYFVVYVAAMAYPLPVLAFLASLILGFVSVLTNRSRVTLFGATLCLGILILEFYSTGSVIPLGILMLSAALGGFLCVWIPLWRNWISKVVASAMDVVFSIFNGVKLAKYMVSIPTGWRVLICLGTLFVLGTVVPVINKGDVRYAVSGICLFFFYGTVGSLIVSVLRASKSLQYSMRWIGIAATLPFVISYVMSHWAELGEPFLYARIPSPSAIQGFVNYLIFWFFSVGLALHLSKILADALIQPLKDILSKIQLIESGNFTARATSTSRDELGALALAVNHMAEGLQRREYVEKTFSRYIDPQVAARILSGNQDEINIAGQRLSATILFADIRGFTKLSEQMPPEEVVKILNTYFGKMVGTVKAHGGVIDKFIGDAMLCVWGVPHATPNGPELAVQCAWQMQLEMQLLNAEFQKTNIPQIGVGIGIHHGIVVAGTLGSSDRMEYTVIGDVVNTAQRVESKAGAQTILITEETFEAVSSMVSVESIGSFSLKGKSQPVPLLRVLEIKQSNNKVAA